MALYPHLLKGEEIENVITNVSHTFLMIMSSAHTVNVGNIRYSFLSTPNKLRVEMEEMGYTQQHRQMCRNNGNG